jgi:hypothetical protein
VQAGLSRPLHELRAARVHRARRVRGVRGRPREDPVGHRAAVGRVRHRGGGIRASVRSA